ncbi:ribosome maturation factor RimM [Bdellovibrio sp. HCB337]|uniref:ribosome maturation factor RimM n=1 Tax=Bdellovibrio sp. HCB337 TaxID=3394358 RepID=UPI0039A4BF03
MEMKLVGKVKDAHGLRGELYILVFAGEASWIKKLKNFELRSPRTEESVAHTVEKIKPFKQGFILKTPLLNDRNAAEAVKGFEFHIPADIFVSKPGETIYLNEILNFVVKNPAQDTIGTIKAFSSNGAQDLLVVETKKGKVEIPFVEAFIKKIDFKHQSVVMDLPEGILDLENL